MQMYLCAICNEWYSADYVIFDKELCDIFCRKHTDAINKELQAWEERDGYDGFLEM